MTTTMMMNKLTCVKKLIEASLYIYRPIIV